MQKISKSIMTVVAASLISMISISAQADNHMPAVELKAKNISGDLTILAKQAQSDGWKVSSTAENNTIEMKKTLTDTYMQTGVHTRWNRKTETVDATALATLSDGKVIIRPMSEIKNRRHQKQFDDAIASLQKGWEKSVPMGSAQ